MTATHTRIFARRALALLALLPLALVGACEVSEEQEVQLGLENSRQINEQLPLVDDPAITGYVNELGLAIARTTPRAQLEWQFYVVDSREVNAFALPGGFIYVNRGLIERMQTMDQLAGVLGHEVGHVVRRHSVDQIKKTTGANVGLTLLCTLTNLCDSRASQVVINAGAAAWFARHSREDEAEADSQAVVNVVAAGIDPQGIPSMFRVLLDARERNPGVMDSFFASHPVEEERITHTRELIARIDPTQLQGLASDSPGFQEMKARLAQLPPPPETPTRQLPAPQFRSPVR